MPKPNQSCGTCRFADWDGKRTPTGRFKRDVTTWCSYVVTLPPLPTSIPSHRLPDPGRWNGWVESTDGTDCPCYEERTDA